MGAWVRGWAEVCGDMWDGGEGPGNGPGPRAPWTLGPGACGFARVLQQIRKTLKTVCVCVVSHVATGPGGGPGPDQFIADR